MTVDDIPRIGGTICIFIVVAIVIACCVSVIIERGQECWHGVYIGSNQTCQMVTR